jgi:transposase
MPRHRLMSDDFERIEIIAGRERRRRWSGEAKLRIVEETLTSGDSVSAVAGRPGGGPPHR